MKHLHLIPILAREIAAGLPAGQPLIVVQVGAHDGRHLDPVRPALRNVHHRAILLEPNPDTFARLVQNYEGWSGVTCVQAAIGGCETTANLWRFKPGQNLPDHASMLASFSEDALLLNGHGYVGELEAVPVPVMRLEKLVEQHNLPRIDYLQVDAEGCDWAIVRAAVECAATKPRLVCFESALMSTPMRNDAYALLERHGYSLLLMAGDTICYQQPESDRMLEYAEPIKP